MDERNEAATDAANDRSEKRRRLAFAALRRPRSGPSPARAATHCHHCGARATEKQPEPWWCPPCRRRRVERTGQSG